MNKVKYKSLKKNKQMNHLSIFVLFKCHIYFDLLIVFLSISFHNWKMIIFEIQMIIYVL